MTIRTSRRSFVTTSVLSAAALLVGVGARAADPGRATIVFVMRHAEKASPTEKDPGLSPEGALRAQALKALLADAGVTHLATTEFRRTRDTLNPLAEHFAIQPKVIDAARTGDLLRWLTNLPPGSVVVVAGHSNTVPAIVQGLGGKIASGAAAMDEQDYGRLFQVIRPASGADPVQVLELHCEP